VTGNQWERIQDLFAAALERAPEQRAAYVRELDEDTALRAEVLALLQAHEARGRLDSIADRLDAPSPVTSVGLPAVFSGRYRIEREVGRGGMARVYLAHDQKHDRQVALKVLQPEFALAVRAERFLREIQIAAKLTHPHILPLHDSGEVEGIVYYVMPYIEGESLRDRLSRENQVPVEDALRIARDVAAALSYAHSHGVVHRDIKPENILLAPGGEAIVADFGIALALTVAGGQTVSEASVAVGTPVYMSPEQGSGSGELDGRSDIYSLGCVVYEMLAGHPPFGGATAQEVIARHALDPIPTLEAARPGVPPGLARAVRKALAKRPVDRFATADQFASALQGTGDDRPTRDRRRATALAVVLTSAGLVVAGGYWFAGRGGASTERSPVTPRVAVMPFANLGPADDQYFVDGITEEITAKLAGLPGLTAITPRSAEYRDGNKSLKQIARELGAQYLLQASIRWQTLADGQRTVRVTTRLIRAADQAQTWANVYDAPLAAADVFRLQSEIAERVAAAMGIALQVPEREALSARPTNNLEAYSYYLQGLQYRKRSQLKVDYLNAISMFERAVELDPRFAQAWARLTSLHALLYWYNHDATPRRLALAKQAAERAFRLDSAEGQRALGAYYYWGRVDWNRALDHLLAAEKTRRADWETTAIIGFIYRRRGEWQRTLEYLHRSLEMDPQNAYLLFHLGLTYSLLRDYAQAAKYFDRSIDLTPDGPNQVLSRAWVHLAWKGDRAAATATLRRGADRMGADRLFAALLSPMNTSRWQSWILAPEADYRSMFERLTPGAAGADSAAYYQHRAELFLRVGQHATARAYSDSARLILEDRLRHSPESPIIHGWLGSVYAVLGMKDAAIREGRKAVELLPVSRDATWGSDWLITLGMIYAMVDEPDSAMQQFRAALAIPSRLSPKLLELIPVAATGVR
jgi:eukaryotic-like serine/threonine-protein kinase